MTVRMINDVIQVPDTQIVTNGAVYGLNNSIRRAKFPMLVRSDTANGVLTDGIAKLAQSPAGEGHDQWLTGVVVQFDLNFTVKGWTELERYHFFDFVSSQSSMHRITGFDLDQAYIKYVDPRIIRIMKEKVKAYNDYCSDVSGSYIPQSGDVLEAIRRKKEELYLEILYSNPTGFRLTAGMTTNYRQLKTVYRQRKNHRLPEWREFCRWIESLPHSELITGSQSVCSGDQ